MTYEMQDKMREKIRESLKKLEACGKPILPGHRVAIKVNVPGPFPPEKAASTHPELVRATVEELKLLGVRVTLYEDCYKDSNMEISGVLKVAEETGVDFVNLKDRPFREIKIGDIVYQYYEEVLEADHLVSLPKMKTHILANYTGAIKLMYGTIPKKQRTLLHEYVDMEDFGRILAEIYSIKLPTLVIMDAIVSMDRGGPTHGTPNPSGLLMISNDGVILDYYASKIMKFNPLEIDSTRIALELGLAKSTPEDVEFMGDSMDQIHLKFSLFPILKGKMKQRYIEMAVGSLTFKEDLCSKCRICEGSCPFHAIHMEGYPVIEKSRCKQCYCCAELCPSGAFAPQLSFGRQWQG